MTVMRRIGASVLIWTAAVATLPAAPASASADGSLNGTYTATSNGEWARTNDVFHNEQNVRAIWTISSQCSYPGECTGTVNSDQGWSTPIYQTGGLWYVKHVVPKWITCWDGSTYDGFQVYHFKGMTSGGDMIDPTADVLIGEDGTTGPSGACGRSYPLFVNMPFKLAKLS